jgi:phosphate transport system substrate-binding protein
MKKTLFAIAALLIGLLTFSFGLPAGEESQAEETISLSGAWALYPMAVKWAEEYQKTHPGVKIDIAAGGAGKGIADCLAGMVDIGMVSREVNPAEEAKGAWKVAVTKDAVVPTVSGANPHLAALLSKGVTKETLQGIWMAGSITTWSAALKSNLPGAIHVYTRSDACGAAETWAKYLGGKQEDLKGIGVYGDPGLAEAVRKDALGIGFNNIGFTYDFRSGKPVEGVMVLPLDLDGNGTISPVEDFYETQGKMVKAIAEGKYPSPPARDLYFVGKGQPSRPAVRDFLIWVLSEGQKYVPETGYIVLPEETLKRELGKLQ